MSPAIPLPELIAQLCEQVRDLADAVDQLQRLPAHPQHRATLKKVSNNCYNLGDFIREQFL